MDVLSDKDIATLLAKARREAPAWNVELDESHKSHYLFRFEHAASAGVVGAIPRRTDLESANQELNHVLGLSEVQSIEHAPKFHDTLRIRRLTQFIDGHGLSPMQVRDFEKLLRIEGVVTEEEGDWFQTWFPRPPFFTADDA